MKKKIYKSYIIMMSLFSAIIIFLSYYTMGVLDRWAVREAASIRLEQISTALDQNQVKTKELTEEIYDNYKSKSRIVAIMLQKNTNIMKSDVDFEELRGVVGASVISVSDNNGIIEYSTNLPKEKNKVRDEFFPAIQNKVFSEALINNDGKSRTIVTGSSRLDSDGVIQIEYPPESAEALLEVNDISNLIDGVFFMEKGNLAIIDARTYKYLGHTNPDMVGIAVQFPADEMEKESGWFESEFQGENVLVQYLKHGNYILTGMLNFSDVYRRRSAVIKWIIFVLAASAFVTFLVARNKILIYESKQKN